MAIYKKITDLIGNTPLVELGNIPCVVFGPVGERLHAPDEWVDLDSMEVCVRTLMDFIRAWCG